MKTVHFSGRVSMMIVLMYLLCHSPKLILTFCEIMFKNPKASLKLQLHNFVKLQLHNFVLKHINIYKTSRLHSFRKESVAGEVFSQTLFPKLLQVVPALFEISHLLLVINCSLNFPIYFLAGGTKFCKTRNNRSQSYKTTSFQMNNLRSLSPSPM